ncbi:regulator of G protein signaling domain protein [Ancylostoma caninum]|uniref:Regulator of G protein signaling domain protein n=1 Tax=Ancylostoma caninum TaxID=29170 RepID=A0A368GE47_ANCCA|nr:regulator of G protein signaling domain protein [Ancylostoma caninum]
MKFKALQAITCLQARALCLSDDGLVQLPLHVVLTNGVAVSYFIDYLQTVGGQNYIDFYLAIEGFKVSVEHQLRTLSNGETVGTEVYETIKEAAQFMYQQYLSQEAITRVPLDDSVIAKFLARVRNDEPCDVWFEQLQDKVIDVLRTDEHFYPGFKKNPLYAKMLAELGITNDEDRPETPASDAGSAYSPSAVSDQERRPSANEIVEEGMVNDGKPVMSAVVETLGIGQQGRQSFALYNVRVSRSVNGKKVSGWNVLRRYSDFHTLHSFIIHKYPKLSNLSFPGKKTFNNLDAHFLEKRTKALNLFLDCVLQPSMLDTYPELENIMFDFLSQKEYLGNREPIAKKVMSAMFDPIKMGVKAVGSTVLAVPDQVYGGVSKVGAGINNAAKVIIHPLNGAPKAPVIDTDRVAAAITDDESTSDNIPLRVLILFVDEVFGVRARNAWFRRQLMTVLRQFVTPFGTSINKRIVDVVHWLTSEQQVTMYLTALRDSVWPDGQLAGDTLPRSPELKARARILAKSLMLSSLPDELRLVLGAETTYTGINTISSALQNKQLNRRLLYVLIERLLLTIFPNNRLDKIFARLHSKSPRSKRA